MKALVLMTGEFITVDELNVNLNTTLTENTPRYVDRQHGGRTYTDNQVMIVADDSAAMCLPIKTLPQVALDLLKSMLSAPYAVQVPESELVNTAYEMARLYFKKICGHGK